MESFAHHFRTERTPRKVLTIIGFVILGIIGAVVLAFLFGYFVMLLWNWIMPAIFGLGTVNFWQAVGVIILARLIFGGFKHSHRDKDHRKFSRRWKKKFKNGNRSHQWYKWKYYDDFWKDEGEKAFDEYVDKKQDPKEEKE